MITHEEAIKIMQVLESDDAYYNERIEEHKKMFKYIKQQEKITELLGLYRDKSVFLDHIMSGDTRVQDIYIENLEKIDKLEKELEEMK